MFSIIIPTMQKDLHVLHMLLLELQESPYVGEILIIDNANIALDTSAYSKVKVLPQEENLYVNPSWNLGIKSASKEFEYFGIINDDLIFSKGFLSQVHEFLKLADGNVGLVGIDCLINTPIDQFDTYPKDTVLEFKQINKMLGFWGSAFFGRKENYHNIPEEMKVFYGDHYLFSRNLQNHKKNYLITNVKIKHIEALTSHSTKRLRNYFRHDRKICIKHNGVEYQHLSTLQKLFSFTYYHEHHVLTILGVKIKIKKKVK